MSDAAQMHQRIASRLAATGLSARKASLLSGIGPDAIRTIKNGHVPSSDRLAALAGVLGCSVGYLLGEEEGEGSTLAGRVQERLDALALNPNSAADKGGLGRDFIRDILRGKVTQPGATNLQKVAAALECSPGYLMGWEDDAGLAAPRPPERAPPERRLAISAPFSIEASPKDPTRVILNVRDADVPFDVGMEIMRMVNEATKAKP